MQQLSQKVSISVQILLVALFGGLIGAAYGFGVYLFPAIAPAMREGFGFTYAQMGITTGLVQAGFFLFALAGGLLTATCGAFAVILGSLILCAATLGGFALAPNFVSASVCLIILGGCAASIWVPMVEISQNFIAARYQGRALGFMSSGTSYGVLVNSLLISALLTASDWRAVVWSAFAITCGLLVCTVVFFRYLQKSPPRTTAATQQPSAANAQDKNLRQKIRAVANKPTAVILVLMFLAGVACMPFQAFLSSYLVDEHNLSVHESAVVWRIIGLTGMVSGFGMGWIADLISARRALLCVCLSLMLSAGLLLGGELQSAQIYSAAILFGLSFYAIYGILPAYISHIYKHGQAALVFSFGSVVLGIGGVLGNVVGGFLKDGTGTFFYLYAICLTAAVLCAGLTFCMRPDHSGERADAQ